PSPPPFPTRRSSDLHCYRLIFEVFGDSSRGSLRPARPRLQYCGLTLFPGPGPQRIERLATDAMLSTKRSHTPTRSILRPISNREDRKSTRLNSSHVS